MSSKKRLFWVGAILLVLVAATVAVLLWPQTPTPTPGVDKTVQLHNFTEAEVTSVTVTRPDATLSFYKVQDGQWNIEGRDPAEVDAAYVFETVNGAAVLTAIEKLADSVDNPADYGFLTPAATVSVHGAEGTLSTLVFGNKTLDQSAYYTQLAGKPEVYLVATLVVKPFLYTPTQYLKKDIFDTSLAEVSAIAVKHPNHGEFRIVRTADPKDEMTLGSWAMTAPYPKETRPQETEDWIQSILSITGEDLIENTLNAPEYGLLTPDVTVTVTTKLGRTEKILMSTEKSALYKVGRDRIYLLPATAKEFLNTAPFSLLEPFLTKVDITTLSSFAWDGHTISLGDRYVLNGKEISSDAFKKAYLELMMVTIMAPAQEADSVALAKPPVFEYTFTAQNGTKTQVSLYEINPQTYLAKINGRTDYRVDAYKVQTAKNALNALLEE
ncbi:MAG: DUF4340 domain-containing protein [Clostridia bacterium]|nr:DUF4340 domain-containing protein [Clostridia bacterium]